MGNLRDDNFANEGARDYLSMLVSKLVATIKEIYSDDERLSLDEDGESMFMPSVELLALVCERYNATPPKPTSIKRWEKRYLEKFDASVESYNADPAFQESRRRIIEQTFRWLIGLAESYWQQ